MKTRINFKGGPLNGKSTTVCEPLLFHMGEVYQLVSRNNTNIVMPIRYKHIGKAFPLTSTDILA